MKIIFVDESKKNNKWSDEKSEVCFENVMETKNE